MKAHYFNFRPTEYLADIYELDIVQQGVYGLVRTLMFCRNGPIVEDLGALSRLAKMRRPHLKKVLDQLVSLGKIERRPQNDGSTKIMCSDIQFEIDRVRLRADDAANSGRKGGEASAVSRKNNGLTEASLPEKTKLTTNHKPLTTNQDKNPPTQPPLGGGDGQDLFQAEQAPKARAPRSRGQTTMKTDWRPSQPAQDQCAAMGLDVEQVIEDVRDYWLSNGKRMVDWDAVFRRRCKDLRVRRKASLRLVHQRDDQVML